MDLVAKADLFMRMAQVLNIPGLSQQQIAYRNHLVRVNQQLNFLTEVVDSILNPTIAKIRHPEWRPRGITMPVQAPMPLNGQPLLRPEALSTSKAMLALAVQLTDMVINNKNTKVSDIQPIVVRINTMLEGLRTTYATSPIMMNADFALPIRQIKDSLFWMSQYQQRAIQEAGAGATPLV